MSAIVHSSSLRPSSIEVNFSLRINAKTWQEISLKASQKKKSYCQQYPK